MKILKFFRFLILLGILIFPSFSYAVNINLGGSTWYTWWQPHWDKEILFMISELSIEPAIMNGPVLSIGVNEHWNVSSLFLIGTYKTKNRGIFFSPSPIPLYNNQTILRYDSDSTIKYLYNEYLNIILGFKYMHYTYKNYEISQTSGILNLLKINKIGMHDYAPCLGIGVQVPIINNFFFVFNSSALFSITNMRTKIKMYLINSGVISVMPVLENNTLFYRIGLNANGSFAYFFPQISTTIIAGFRYQMLHIIKNKKPTRLDREGNDHFYGITASAVYRWNFK